MRATTRSMPNVSFATRAISTLELSPLVTAATAPGRSMPASIEHVAVETDALQRGAGEVLGRAVEPSVRRSITTTE